VKDIRGGRRSGGGAQQRGERWWLRRQRRAGGVQVRGGARGGRPGERRLGGEDSFCYGGVRVSRLSFFIPAHKLSLDSKSETSRDSS
jgi:hypothetical protein